MSDTSRDVCGPCTERERRFVRLEIRPATLEGVVGAILAGRRAAVAEWRSPESAPDDDREIVVKLSDGKKRVVRRIRILEGEDTWEWRRPGVQHIETEILGWLPLPEEQADGGKP